MYMTSLGYRATVHRRSYLDATQRGRRKGAGIRHRKGTCLSNVLHIRPTRYATPAHDNPSGAGVITATIEVALEGAGAQGRMGAPTVGRAECAE